MSWKVGTYNGFNIFEPTPETVPEGRAHVDRTIRENLQFLSKLSVKDKEKSPKKITGTFIQAHAPDYVGGNTLNWNKSDWEQAFDKLKTKQIDTVIFQASVWNELQEVYYKSKILTLKITLPPLFLFYAQFSPLHPEQNKGLHPQQSPLF